MSDDDVAECNDDTRNMPEETAAVQVYEKSQRCAVTGKFLPGNVGGGRPKGSKDKLNKQVISTLEKLWEARGADMVEQLAAEKPEVMMAMISRMIPQALAAEAITGVDSTENSQGNQEVRITLVNQVADTHAITHNDIPKEVQGELMLPDTTH
jgi:hypothetical protein